VRVGFDLHHASLYLLLRMNSRIGLSCSMPSTSAQALPSGTSIHVSPMMPKGLLAKNPTGQQVLAYAVPLSGVTASAHIIAAALCSGV